MVKFFWFLNILYNNQYIFQFHNFSVSVHSYIKNCFPFDVHYNLWETSSTATPTHNPSPGIRNNSANCNIKSFKPLGFTRLYFCVYTITTPFTPSYALYPQPYFCFVGQFFQCPLMIFPLWHAWYSPSFLWLNPTPNSFPFKSLPISLTPFCKKRALI